MGNAERTKPLTLVGPKGLERVVSALRMIAPELPFGLRFVELTEAREHLRLGPYEIDAFRVNHNVVCYGYALSIPRKGKFDVDRAKASNIPVKLWNRLQKGESIEWEGSAYTPDMVMGPARRGLKVVYCTDTRPVPVIAEYAREADLFICEGMYGEDGKEAKAREYKHMTFYEAAKLAKEAGPKVMWLTHYSPSLTRPEEFMDKVKSIFPAAVAAKDGRTVELEFDEE
jgi:ribonuclease Z